MKKNIIALAVASAIAAPVAMADAPTIYGKLNLNVGSVTDKGTGVNDTASRFGIKGSEDLGNGLKTVYKIEFGIDIEGKGGISDRNQYLGLAGGFGTVLLGQHDSPLKMTQTSDLFNDGAADNNKIKSNGTVLGILNDNGETRATNVLAYVSPSFSGVKLIAAGTSFGRDTGTGKTAFQSAAEVTDIKKRALFNGMHIAATYGSTKKGLFVSAAQNSYNKYITGNKTFTENQIGAQYKTGGLTVNGMVRTFNDGDSSTRLANEGTMNALGAAYKMGKITVKGKYMTADGKATASKKGSQTAIGLGYSLGKKTSAYVYTTTADKKATGAKASTSSFIGMVHKF